MCIIYDIRALIWEAWQHVNSTLSQTVLSQSDGGGYLRFDFSRLFEAAKRGLRWTRQFIAEPRRETNSLSHSHLRTTRSSRLTSRARILFWTVGGGWSTRKEPTQTQGEQATSTQKGLRPVSEPSRNEWSQWFPLQNAPLWCHKGYWCR